MDQSKTTLYKNSLYLTTGIFVLLMCAATSAPARIHDAKFETVALSNTTEITELGRFVVTPLTTRFVAPSPAMSDTHSVNNLIPGAM